MGRKLAGECQPTHSTQWRHDSFRPHFGCGDWLGEGGYLGRTHTHVWPMAVSLSLCRQTQKTRGDPATQGGCVRITRALVKLLINDRSVHKWPCL